MNEFLTLILIVALLIAAWFIVERFSPDPLITKLCQIAIFIAALYVIVKHVWPLVA